MAPLHSDIPVPKTRGPRLYHKKSRTGCARCKQRRVKCDEARPSCGGCSRHLVDCVYPMQTSTAQASTSATDRLKGKGNEETNAMNLSTIDAELDQLSASTAKRSPASNRNGSTSSSSHYQSPDASGLGGFVDDIDEAELDFPECRERRLWELRLLHNSLTQATPFPTPQPPQIQNLFSVEVPKMAINEGQDAILYGIMAHSALNLWARSTDPQERETLIRLERTYLSMMLRQQRKDIAGLNSANVDAICLSSLKILTHALALIQTLPLEPWQPPIDFMQMGHGTGIVFRTAWELAKAAGTEGLSKTMTFLRHPPVLRDPNETVLSDHSALDWILETPPGPNAHLDTEMDDAETRSIYHKAIAYICSIQRAYERNEPEYAICRRLGGFAVWAPPEFTQFLSELRPRAMVVMAHFMSMCLPIEQIWVIGKAGENQIRGINKNLPMEWCYKLDGLFQKFRKPEETTPPFSGGYGAMM